MSSLTKVKSFCSFDPETFRVAYPVVSVECFPNGVFRVERKSQIKSLPFAREGRKGKKIKMLSNKSLSLLIATVQATDVEFHTMMTLTYPMVYPQSGKTVKIALNGILTNLRNKGEFEYLWFLEFQKRGAPHIHILTDHDGITPRMRINLAEWWVSRMVNSAWMTEGANMESIKCDKCAYDVIAQNVRRAFAVTLHRDTWQVVREKDGAKRYVTKYASKPEQKVVPDAYADVGRFWGCSRQVSLGNGPHIKTSESEFVEFLRQQDHPVSEFDILPKYVYGVENV